MNKELNVFDKGKMKVEMQVPNQFRELNIKIQK